VLLTNAMSRLFQTSRNDFGALISPSFSQSTLTCVATPVRFNIATRAVQRSSWAYQIWIPGEGSSTLIGCNPYGSL